MYKNDSTKNKILNNKTINFFHFFVNAKLFNNNKKQPSKNSYMVLQNVASYIGHEKLKVDELISSSLWSPIQFFTWVFNNAPSHCKKLSRLWKPDHCLQLQFHILWQMIITFFNINQHYNINRQHFKDSFFVSLLLYYCAIFYSIFLFIIDENGNSQIVI